MLTSIEIKKLRQFSTAKVRYFTVYKMHLSSGHYWLYLRVNFIHGSTDWPSDVPKYLPLGGGGVLTN